MPSPTLAIIALLEPWDPVAASAVSVRLTDTDDARVATGLDGQSWTPALMELGELSEDQFNPAFTGWADPSSGSLSFDVSAIPNAGRFSWEDRRVRVWTGPVGAAFGSYTLRFDGLMARPTAAEGLLRLQLRSDDAWAAKPILPTYAGTGGLEGPATLKGQPKPLAFGAPRFVAPVLIDAVELVWQFHGLGSARAVTQAFDRLVRYPPPLGDDANLAALLAASIPAGQYRTCLAHGLVRFGAPPVGPLTLSVEGDNGTGAGWIRRPGALINRLATIAGATAGQINGTNLTALDAAVPRNLSLYLFNQVTPREAIAQIAGSCNAMAIIGLDGKLRVTRAAIGSPVMTLAADGTAIPQILEPELLETSAPWYRLAMEADRAWRIHGTGDFNRFDFADIEGPTKPEDGATRNKFRGQWAGLALGTAFALGDEVLDQNALWTPVAAHAKTAINGPPTLPTTSNATWELKLESGAGSPGLNTATAVLYGRGASAPALPAGSIDYTFSTGGMTGIPMGLSATPLGPLAGEKQWRTQAPIAGVNAVETIAPAAWTAFVEWVRDGEDAPAGQLTNEAHSVPASPAGVVGSFVGAGGNFLVFLGTTDITSSCTFALAPSGNPEGLTQSIGASSGTYAVTGAGSWPDADNVATVTYRATLPAGGHIDKIFTLTKSPAGEDGDDGAAGDVGVSTRTVFRRFATVPTTPTASAGTPPDWYATTTAVPAGSEPMWSSTGERPQGGGNYAWGTPIRHEAITVAQTGDWQYLVESTPSPEMTFTLQPGQSRIVTARASYPSPVSGGSGEVQIESGLVGGGWTASNGPSFPFNVGEPGIGFHQITITNSGAEARAYRTRGAIIIASGDPGTRDATASVISV